MAVRKRKKLQYVLAWGLFFHHNKYFATKYAAVNYAKKLTLSNPFISISLKNRKTDKFLMIHY